MLPGMPQVCPFERRALEKTISGLGALREVLDETHKMGKFHFEPFFDRVNDGVNADLCEAIIGKSENNQAPLQFSVSWSSVFALKYPHAIPERVKFDVSHYPHIKEAAREFRKKEPQEITITGYVIRLHKEEESGGGDITVVTTFDGKRRKIRMTLPSSEYQVATKAHQKWLEVTAKGILLESKLKPVSLFAIQRDLWE